MTGCDRCGTMNRLFKRPGAVKYIYVCKACKHKLDGLTTTEFYTNKVKQIKRQIKALEEKALFYETKLDIRIVRNNVSKKRYNDNLRINHKLKNKKEE